MTMLATLMGLALSATAPAQAQVQAEAAPCPLTVSFASYAMGIDRGAYDRVDRLLKRDRAVRNVDAKRWGREGEVTLCVQTRTRADAKRLFSRIKAMIPAKPRGPVTVETASGLKFHAPRQR